jgi:hypothetical protein
MRSLLKACGVGALAYSGLLVGLMVALTAVSADTPLRRGLKDIMDIAIRPLVVLLPSDLGHHEDVVFAFCLIAVSSAICGALAGSFVWLVVNGFSRGSHATKPRVTVLGLASRDTPSADSDATLPKNHR